MDRLPRNDKWSSEKAPQSFVKFFGSNSDRAPRTRTTLSAVQRAGNHAVCTYPTRQAADGRFGMAR